jgi:hypothetical protein
MGLHRIVRRAHASSRKGKARFQLLVALHLYLCTLTFFDPVVSSLTGEWFPKHTTTISARRKGASQHCSFPRKQLQVVIIGRNRRHQKTETSAPRGRPGYPYPPRSNELPTKCKVTSTRQNHMFAASQ